MNVLISGEGTLSLQDIENFNSFSIVEANGETKQGKAAVALADMAEAAEENHFWLSADAVIALSSRKDDQQWLDAFWGMLKKVEAYGYSDLEKGRIKAHVEAGS